MPTDLASIADPVSLVMAWASGLAFVAGFVSFSRVVGPGFIWLTAGVAAAVGLTGVFGDSPSWAWIGLALLVIGLVWARNPGFAGVALVLGGVCQLIAASQLTGVVPASTAALALGGVTGEMMLGHWYLVDPRLPRWTLRVLAFTGILGLVADALVMVGLGSIGGGAGVAFWVLMATSVVLMVGVVGALRYPAYSGVMAATGLSYLAVLTTLGAVFLGRALVAGLGPFAG